MVKQLTDDEREMFQQFTADYPMCWACGVPEKPSWVETTHGKPDYPRNLERAHIIGGAGRIHDRRNLAMLCKMCHDITHGARIFTGKEYMKPLRLDHILWLQYRMEGCVDRKFLRSISVSIFLPRLTPVPTWYRNQFVLNRGITHEQWRA